MRAMSSLQETHEAILQYLEAAAQGEVDASDPIILAATRSLGRWNSSTAYLEEALIRTSLRFDVYLRFNEGIVKA